MDKFANVIRAVCSTAWAIDPVTLQAIVELLELRSAGGAFSAEDIRARIGAGDPPRSGRAAGGIAVLPVFGVIAQRMNMMAEISGGTSTEQLSARFRDLMADPAVGSIVLNVDSPGGSVFGVPELAAEIRAARGDKPIVALANARAASAAYWLASAADEIVVTPSGEVGSIGVFTVHSDQSALEEKAGIKTTVISAGEHKTEGNPHEALSDDARAYIQARVDSYYSMFVDDVAAGRGIPSVAVRDGFGQGRMTGAADAAETDMADSVETLDELLVRLGAGETGPGGRVTLAGERAHDPLAESPSDQGDTEQDPESDLEPNRAPARETRERRLRQRVR